MRSPLFDHSNMEVQSAERFVLQNSKMLKVTLGPDVLAVKGTMVAFQGRVEFAHEGAGSASRLLKKMVSGDDQPLMRVSGEGEVFFASSARNIFLVHLEGDGLSVNGQNLLAFDAAVSWDIHRVQRAGMVAGGAFNTLLQGSGTVALVTGGTPVLLDCSQQPTAVDIQAAVAWSPALTPQLVHSMKFKSMLRGGSGEAAQLLFHGPGFVIVQPSEGPNVPPHSHSGGGGGGGIMDLFGQ